MATLSNCGEFLQAFATKSKWKHLDGQVNSLGYGNNAKDWIIRSQAPKGVCFQAPMEKVQRLSGSGLRFEKRGLR